MAELLQEPQEYMPGRLKNAGIWNYKGGVGVEVNGGTANLTGFDIKTGDNAAVVNRDGVLNISETYRIIYSQKNGVLVNDGGVVNINSEENQGVNVFEISGTENAIYLNGGTVNINGSIDLGSSTSEYGIYINKGFNTVTGGDTLVLSKWFAIGYYAKSTAVYINGVKQNELDSSCSPVTDDKNEPSQIVNVPATSAYASIVIIVLGIVCVIISIIVTRRVTKKS